MAGVDLILHNPDVNFENLPAGKLELVAPKWIYLNDNNQRMCMNLRNNFVRLANELIKEGDKDRAVKVLDRCLEVMPATNVPFNYFMLGIMEGYFAAGNTEKGTLLARELMNMYEAEVYWFADQERDIFNKVRTKAEQSRGIAYEIRNVVAQPNRYPQGEIDPKTGQPTSGLAKEFSDRFNALNITLEEKLQKSGGRR